MNNLRNQSDYPTLLEDQNEALRDKLEEALTDDQGCWVVHAKATQPTQTNTVWVGWSKTEVTLETAEEIKNKLVRSVIKGFKTKHFKVVEDQASVTDMSSVRWTRWTWENDIKTDEITVWAEYYRHLSDWISR